MDSTPQDGVAQPQPLPFLVGSISDNLQVIDTCPFAGSITCWSSTHNRHLLIALPCKRWGCRWCGPRRARRLAYKVEAAKPTRLITLTIDPKLWEDPRAAYDGTRRKLSDFSKSVKKHVGEFEYLRVLEVTKRGWPHYHLMARCSYISQAIISQVWGAATGAPIVDIRAIDKRVNVFWYVIKYLCKQTHVPWTTRRVSWSRNFFEKEARDEEAKWKLRDRERTQQHPTTVAANLYYGKRLTKLTSNAWELHPDDDSRFNRLQHWKADHFEGTCDTTSADVADEIRTKSCLQVQRELGISATPRT